MNWSKAYEIEKWGKRWGIVVSVFPYQCAVGVGVRWLRCTPGVRIYLGFVKIAITYLAPRLSLEGGWKEVAERIRKKLVAERAVK